MTPEKIAAFANPLNLALHMRKPWKKISLAARMIMAASSPRRAFTETHSADSADKYSNLFATATANARGHGGTPLILSHGFYNTGWLFHPGPFP